MGGIVPAICGEVDALDFMAIARANPSKDSDLSAIFGSRSKVLMSPGLSEVTVPLWAVATGDLQGDHEQVQPRPGGRAGSAQPCHG